MKYIFIALEWLASLLSSLELGVAFKGVSLTLKRQREEPDLSLALAIVILFGFTFLFLAKDDKR